MRVKTILIFILLFKTVFGQELKHHFKNVEINDTNDRNFLNYIQQKLDSLAIAGKIDVYSELWYVDQVPVNKLQERKKNALEAKSYRFEYATRFSDLSHFSLFGVSKNYHFIHPYLIIL
jgi:hypothetical protein